MSEAVLVDGTTGDGTHVRVTEGEGSYFDRFHVEIDGTLIPYSDASRLRDGGTTTIRTDRGDIFAFRQMGAEDRHFESFNGERLTRAGSGDVDRAWQAHRKRVAALCRKVYAAESGWGPR